MSVRERLKIKQVHAQQIVSNPIEEKNEADRGKE